MDTGAKSRVGLKGTFLYICEAISMVLAPISRVCPSLALATASAPMLPLAPGWFTTTTGWPRTCDRRGCTVRAMVSIPVPGVNGTMILTDWVGQAGAWDQAEGAAMTVPMAARLARRVT